LPTDNPRPEKVAVVDEVREKLQNAQAAILTEYRGLTVGEISALRRTLREQGGEYRIYKNTLVRFAVRDLGLDELEQSLVGPTAIAFIEGDAVGVAKALRDYARTNPPRGCDASRAAAIRSISAPITAGSPGDPSKRAATTMAPSGSSEWR